jgi:short-subunit dehydrogenase
MHLFPVSAKAKRAALAFSTRWGTLAAMRPLALVTGGSAGIGAAFARQLAGRGYDLILVARHRERLAGLAADLERDHGIRAEAFAADLVTDEGQGAVEQRILAEERLELLVNNAGFGSRGKFTDLDVAPQDRMHRLHVLATLRLTHAALRGMTARRRGAIINVSSVAAFTTAPGSVSYCATKHWMNVFTEGLHLELRNAGSPVVMQALCPGFTISEFHDHLDFDRTKVPKFLWLRADNVVAESLRGLDQGRLFVVTGWQYRLAVGVVRLLPAPLVRWINTRRQRRFNRT